MRARRFVGLRRAASVGASASASAEASVRKAASLPRIGMPPPPPPPYSSPSFGAVYSYPPTLRRRPPPRSGANRSAGDGAATHIPGGCGGAHLPAPDPRLPVAQVADHPRRLRAPLGRAPEYTARSACVGATSRSALDLHPRAGDVLEETHVLAGGR